METYNQLPKAMMLLNQGHDEDFVVSEVIKGLYEIDSSVHRYTVAHKIVDKAVNEIVKANEYKLLKYVGQRIAVTFNHEWQEAIPQQDGTFKITDVIKGRKTITGKVFLHDGTGMILQDDDVVTQFNTSEGMGFEIEVLN